MTTTYFTKATVHGIETFSALGKTIIKEVTGQIHIYDSEFCAEYIFDTLEDAMRWVVRYGSFLDERPVFLNGMRIQKSQTDFDFGQSLVGEDGYINPVVYKIFWERYWAYGDMNMDMLKETISHCEDIAKERRDQGLEGYAGYDDEDFMTEFTDTPVKMEHVEFNC